VKEEFFNQQRRKKLARSSEGFFMKMLAFKSELCEQPPPVGGVTIEVRICNI